MAAASPFSMATTARPVMDSLTAPSSSCSARSRSLAGCGYAACRAQGVLGGGGSTLVFSRLERSLCVGRLQQRLLPNPQLCPCAASAPKSWREHGNRRPAQGPAPAGAVQ